MFCSQLKGLLSVYLIVVYYLYYFLFDEWHLWERKKRRKQNYFALKIFSLMRVKEMDGLSCISAKTWVFMLCKEDEKTISFSYLQERRERLFKKVLLQIWGTIVLFDVAYAVTCAVAYYRLNCILGYSKLSSRNINLHIVILFMSRNFKIPNKSCSDCNSKSLCWVLLLLETATGR